MQEKAAGEGTLGEQPAAVAPGAGPKASAVPAGYERHEGAEEQVGGKPVKKVYYTDEKTGTQRWYLPGSPWREFVDMSQADRPRSYFVHNKRMIVVWDERPAGEIPSPPAPEEEQQEQQAAEQQQEAPPPAAAAAAAAAAAVHPRQSEVPVTTVISRSPQASSRVRLQRDSIYSRQGTVIPRDQNENHFESEELTLEEVLRVPQYASIFNDFCKKAMAQDSLVFLKEVQHFEKLFKWETAFQATGGKSPLALQKEAGMAIYDVFLKADAKRQVNVGHKVIAEIEVFVEKGIFDSGLFAEAVGEIHRVVREDVWVRFQRSDGYKAILRDRSGQGAVKAEARPSFSMLHTHLENYRELDQTLEALLKSEYSKPVGGGLSKKVHVIEGARVLDALVELKLSPSRAMATSLAQRLALASLLSPHKANNEPEAAGFNEKLSYRLIPASKIVSSWERPISRSEPKTDFGELLLKTGSGGPYQQVFVVFYSGPHMLLFYRDAAHSVGHSEIDTARAEVKFLEHKAVSEGEDELAISTLLGDSGRGMGAPRASKARPSIKAAKKTDFPTYMTITVPGGKRVLVVKEQKTYKDMLEAFKKADYRCTIKTYHEGSTGLDGSGF